MVIGHKDAIQDNSDVGKTSEIGTGKHKLKKRCANTTLNALPLSFVQETL